MSRACVGSLRLLTWPLTLVLSFFRHTKAWILLYVFPLPSFSDPLKTTKTGASSWTSIDRGLYTWHSITRPYVWLLIVSWLPYRKL